MKRGEPIPLCNLSCMSITKRKRENEEENWDEDDDDDADFDGHGRGVSVTAGDKKRVLTRFRHDRIPLATRLTAFIFR